MILFLDIETVSDDTIDRWAYLDRYAEKINFMPEFNRVFCISIWYEDSDWERKYKTLSWDEQKIISDFFDIIKNYTVCWFNIKMFDIPFIIKRAMKCWISIPSRFRVFYKKPWEIEGMLDLYDAYKHIGINSATLYLACNHLWVESSKDWIDGSMVQNYVDSWRWDEVIIFWIQNTDPLWLVHLHYNK